MNTQTESPETKRKCDAFEAGVKAFKRGNLRVPAMDTEFGPTQLGRYPSVQEMISWMKGWDTENLLDSNGQTFSHTL